MPRARSLESFSHSLRRIVLAAAAIVILQATFATPSSADEPGRSTPTNPSCERSRGLRALVKPIDKLKCVLGVGDPKDTRKAEISTASYSREIDPEVRSWGPTMTTPRGAVIPVNAPRQLSDCTPDEDLPIPSMVGSIFRCRLTEAGFSPDEVRYFTAEAVTVAECESLFDADAVVFDGKYRDQAHPGTGLRYSAAGVFQFIRATGDTWIEGGYENVHDPVANIDAAARLMIANMRIGALGWGDWACAAVNDGFAHQSVLPGWPGGPSKLPTWAFRF